MALVVAPAGLHQHHAHHAQNQYSPAPDSCHLAHPMLHQVAHAPAPEQGGCCEAALALHAQRQQPNNRPAGGLVRWVVHTVLRKHRQQDQEQQQQVDTYPHSLVSGSSFDSLRELEQLACGSDTPPVGLTRGSVAPPPQQQQQQQQQPLQCEHALGFVAQQPPLAQPVGPAPSPPPAAAEGRVRRCVRAVLRPLVRAVCSAARAVTASAGPQGPGNNDNTPAERIFNVLTSLPFFAVGVHGLRHRRSGRGRQFALSFVLVGAVASCYHGVTRASRLRVLMRRLDYYSIAVASTFMRRAAHISLPRIANLAAVAVAPFKPTLVTGLNLALVEGKYLRSALAHAHLRGSFKTHLVTAAVGLTCFGFEDVAIGAGWPPVLHSAWHVLSAAAMGCTHALFGHLELAMLAEGIQLEALAGRM